MKRSILILAALLFMSLTAAYAQRDTTEVSPSVEYTNDMIEIKASDLPQSVQEALKATIYKGWESGDVFRSETSDRYAVRFGEGTTPKTYYFDAKGKPLKGNK